MNTAGVTPLHSYDVGMQWLKNDLEQSQIMTMQKQ